MLLRHSDNRTLVWKSLARITVQCEKYKKKHRQSFELFFFLLFFTCEKCELARIEEVEVKERRRKELSQNKEHRNGDDDDFFFFSLLWHSWLPNGMSYDNSSSSHHQTNNVRLTQMHFSGFVSLFAFFSIPSSPSISHNVPNMALTQPDRPTDTQPPLRVSEIWNSRKKKSERRRVWLFVCREEEEMRKK